MTRRGDRLASEIDAAVERLEEVRRAIKRERDEFHADLESVREAALNEKAAVERRHKQRTDDLEREAAAHRKTLSTERAQLSEERGALRRDERAFQLLAEGQLNSFCEELGELWAEYELTRGNRAAAELRSKPHPAMTAAKTVQLEARELADARKEMALARGLVVLYEGNFPWLSELRDFDLTFPLRATDRSSGEVRGQEFVAESEDAEDPARNWLTREEFQALTSADRNQLALERYLNSRKTPWEIGRDFELYVGHLRELAGYRVIYQGIVEGFDDLGRDLLCSRSNELEVVQCKRWAAHKVIHEKHIFQLFGTMVAARIKHPEMVVTGTFVTTTNLTDRAREFANELGIRVEENFPMGEFPRIKCNIARKSGDRIYHLPFDQQYDRTVVEPTRGERWASTAHEAEEAGFRRAYRWRGEAANA